MSEVTVDELGRHVTKLEDGWTLYSRPDDKSELLWQAWAVQEASHCSRLDQELISLNEWEGGPANMVLPIYFDFGMNREDAEAKVLVEFNLDVKRLRHAKQN